MTSTQTDIVVQILAAELPNLEFSIPCLVGQGVVSSVYRVDAEEKSYAVKLHTSDLNNLSSYEAEEYEREYRWLANAATVGIPCSQVFAIGWYENTAYSIQTFIQGANGLESHLDPVTIWQELGRLAHLIHAIPVENAEAKWRSYYNSILAGLTEDDVKVTLGMYAAHQQADIRHVFEKLGKLPFQFGLNHCDLHPKNTIVSSDNQIFLMDWGAASRDINLVPHSELASLFWTLDVQSDAFHAFIKGYGLSEAELIYLMPEVLALDLISCFWYSKNPPVSEFDHELIAHTRRLVADHLLQLVQWASQ